MLPSHINQLAEAYAQIAEGKKSEEEVKDWNRKDDNPEGKKVDKKKVDKCTCESFYLKRLQAMNPVYAEQYRAIAEVLIGEGYESARLLDNIIEALPMNVVGPEFVSAMKAVNPRIHENLETTEKRQARAIVFEQQATGFFPLDLIRGTMNNWRNRNKKSPGPDQGVGTKPRVAQPYLPPRPQVPAADAEKFFGTNKYGEGGSTTSTAAPAAPAAAKPAPAAAKPAPVAAKPAPVAAKPAPAAPKPDPNADYKALQAKAKSAGAAGDFKAASAATREAETLGQTKFKAKFGANYGRRSGMTPNPLMSANPPKSKMTYNTKNPLMDSHEVEGEMTEGWKEISANVTDALPWNRNTEYTTQGKRRKPGENVHGQQTGRGLNTSTSVMTKGGTDKTTPNLKRQPPLQSQTVPQRKPLVQQNNSFDPKGELVEYAQGGGGSAPNVPAGVAKFVDELPSKVKGAAKKVKKVLTGEEVQMEGVRDEDAEKGTKERKERLEKKRGHSVDDHPQYKKDKKDDSYLETNMKKRQENNEKARKEMAAQKDDTVPRWMKDDFNLYDIILTYLDENGLMDSVEHAEAIMEQLTAEQIESIVEEILSEDPVQDYRDRRRAAENRAGDRGPELSHSNEPRSREFSHGGSSKPQTKKPNTTSQGTKDTSKPKPRSREFSHGSSPQPRSREFSHGS